MENIQKNRLRIRFLGAIGTVSGSCTLLEYQCYGRENKRYFLIDAGAFQNEGNNEQELERRKVLKYFAKKIDIIFITHAHLDHIGILPDIIEYGFEGKVCCTWPTKELIVEMLTSSNDKEEIARTLKKLEKKRWIIIEEGKEGKENRGSGKTYRSLDKNFRYGFLRSSHILGSCTFYFQYTEKYYPEDYLGDNPIDSIEWKYLYFTGDIGPVSKSVIANDVYKDHQTPYWDKYDNCIVMESTYGGKSREKKDICKRKITQLSEIIGKAIENKSTVIIPAFALDRAQQILIDLFYLKDGRKEPIDKETTWETILKNTHNRILYNAKEIWAIPSLDNDNEKREKIQREIKLVLDPYNDGISNDTDKKLFPDNDKECRDKIIDILEENIDKPEYLPKFRKLSFRFDSPLIEKVNKIYFRRLTDEEYKGNERKFRYISNNFLSILGIPNTSMPEKKKAIEAKISQFMETKQSEVKIIVTASGMCDEGKVVNYLEQYLEDENTIIILTGFQAKDTNGSILKKLSNNEYTEEQKKGEFLKLPSRKITLEDIKCKIEDMSEYYSGHADQEQLLDYIKPEENIVNKLTDGKKTLGKTTVLLNHGTEEARESLKEKMEERDKNIKVILPEFNRWLNIATFDYEPEDIEIDFEKSETDEYIFTKIGDIHLYYPKEYEKGKMQSIIDYITEKQ